MFDKVTVIVACRDEQNFISACLDSIVAQDYSKDWLEVFVVDGMSRDGTREIVAGYCQKYPFVKLLDNPKKTTPFAFNIGIKNAHGDYLAFMGAHAEYQNDYLSKCLRHALETGADNVGGAMIAKPVKNDLTARAIALSLASSFAAGGAFRKKIDKPISFDTAFGGFYKKSVFDKIGLFDERLARSQDMEFNIRLKKAGGKIMLFPDIVVNYYPKSKFLDFFVHNFWDGVWAVYPLKFIKMPLKWRHYIPLFFILSLISFLGLGVYRREWFAALFGLLAVYGLFLFFFAARIAAKERDWRYLFLMPAAFAIRHFGYGIGSFWGIIKLLMPARNGAKG